MSEIRQSSGSSARPAVALVGGSGGIGSAVARRLSAEGFRVHIGGRSAGRAQEIAAEIGGRAHEVDGTDFAAVEVFARAAAQEGPLVGMANFAGSLLLKPAHLTTPDELEETLALNLTTAFATVRAAARAMKDGGSVVLMSSAAADVGLPNHEAIAAAKGGVASLARAAAASYAKRGLRVNAVAPGLVDTPLTARIVGSERSLEASRRLHPLGRIGKPDDVAAAVVWLLTDASGWVTGQVVPVDGGLSRLKAGA